VNFDSFSFHPQIEAGIRSAGYSTPTTIQSRTMPSIIEGRDVLGLAQTGTGKTAAFVLPILQRLMEGRRGRLRALIISPTRELAEQTHAAIQVFGRKTGLRSVTVYGGVSTKLQIRGLKSGAEIVVACPGRLLDLMGQKQVNLNDIEVLVLDEADRMFDMGFLPDIRRIIRSLPTQRQTLLFSATMPPEIRHLTDTILRDPLTVEIDTSRPVASISHAVYGIDQAHKTDLLLEILYSAGKGQILVFTKTKHRAQKLANTLAKAGFAATCLQGNLSQSRRQQAMDGFRSGRVQVMVATDIAARGIDVSDITHVINYDMPDTGDAYTHRIGRTGRMAQRGTALSLATPADLPMIHTIEGVLGGTLERRKANGFEGGAFLSEKPHTTRPAPSQPFAARRGMSSRRRRSFPAAYSKR
jgi:ATP-dependent RNA helicase RhlE